jgi:hypothetical protein
MTMPQIIKVNYMNKTQKITVFAMAVLAAVMFAGTLAMNSSVNSAFADHFGHQYFFGHHHFFHHFHGGFHHFHR